MTEPRRVSKRVLGKSLDSLMDGATKPEPSPMTDELRAHPAPSASSAGPGLRQFVRVSVGAGAPVTEPVSETASSAPIQSTASPKRFRPAPLPERRASSPGLVTLGLLLADAARLVLAFSLVNATPGPSGARLLLCAMAVVVAGVVGCLAVVSLEEER